MSMTRRDAVKGLVASSAVVATGKAAFADPAWEPWRELVNFLPDATSLKTARAGRGRPALEFMVQKIEAAVKPKVNLDRYEVKITALPSSGPAAGGADALYSYVRRNLNDFLDHSVSELKGHLAADDQEWSGSGALGIGCMMVFHIKWIGLPAERGAVAVSKTAATSWRFSPVTIDQFIIGTHPVAGNRDFGLKPAGGGQFVFYTQAADRAFDNLPPESVVLEGAKALWKSFQVKLRDFVVAHGGNASIVTPIVYEPTFDEVKNGGLFTRA